MENNDPKLRPFNLPATPQKRFRFNFCKFKKPLLLLIILLLVTVPLLYLYFTYPTISPFGSAQLLSAEINYHHLDMNKKVTGFLPYWRLDDAKYIQFATLSEVIYFSLTVDQNGNFVKIVNGQTEPGYRWWNSQTIKDLIAKTQILQDKFSVSIAMQKNSDIKKFLDNPSAWDNLENNVLSQVKSRHLNGVNLDFEYDGKPDDIYRQKFTDFCKSFTAKLKQESPDLTLSIDTYPLSVRDIKLTDIPSLKDLFDEYIVMSYDYYSSSSDMAGPVAPISGTQGKNYYFDVTSTYADYAKVIPTDKTIMGVPYYGWDWPVKQGQVPLSPVLPGNDANGYPEVLSYGRMRTDTDLKTNQCLWDETAQETWCWYTDPKTQTDHQVWFENDRSIAAKYDFANQHSLGGVAIWTLGYDNEYTDLWNLIKQKFTKN